MLIFKVYMNHTRFILSTWLNEIKHVFLFTQNSRNTEILFALLVCSIQRAHASVTCVRSVDFVFFYVPYKTLRLRMKIKFCVSLWFLCATFPAEVGRTTVRPYRLPNNLWVLCLYVKILCESVLSVCNQITVAASAFTCRLNSVWEKYVLMHFCQKPC